MRSAARVGRNIEYQTNKPAPNSPHNIFEWQDQPLDISTLGANKQPKFGEWSDFQQTLPNLEVRIGSLYALERISQDSHRDYLQILEIICAYVRENSPANGLEPSLTIKERPAVRSDIQTAITYWDAVQENR